MKILIVGAGRIGSSIAESLVSEANDITIVDTNPEHIAYLQSRFDLRGVVGNATSPQVLTDAGAADTDMLISVPSSDETNLVVSLLCAQMFENRAGVAADSSPDQRITAELLETVGDIAGAAAEGAAHAFSLKSQVEPVEFIREKAVGKPPAMFKDGVVGK